MSAWSSERGGEVSRIGPFRHFWTISLPSRSSPCYNCQMWSVDDFDLDDETNRSIWETSPQILTRVHGLLKANTKRPRFTGRVGVQQAMIGCDGRAGFDDEPLPLVPDLVGIDTGQNPKRAVLVLGSCYAPFIKGISKRNAIASSIYRDIPSTGQFQRLFFSRVMVGDPYYYGILEDRFEGIRSPRELIVSDLCRGSFCLRGNHCPRIDVGGDSVVNGSHPDMKNPSQLAEEARSLFSAYVDAESAWTWQRIQSVKAIVTLGKIAQRLILTLFDRKGANISMKGNEKAGEIRFQKYDNNGRMAEFEEHEEQQLSNALSPSGWWNARLGSDNWQIVPVYHPAACRNENSRREELVCKKLKELLTA